MEEIKDYDYNEVSKEILFNEKVALSVERERLEKELLSLQEEKRKFEATKKDFLQKMHSLTEKQDGEKRFLEQEQLIFTKKQKILEKGYRQLADDRNKFEQEVQVNRMVQRRSEEEWQIREYGSVKIFFNGVNNTLALRKRYKDLMKIFHPDNLCGDKETIQLINEEYGTLQNHFD